MLRLESKCEYMIVILCCFVRHCLESNPAAQVSLGILKIAISTNLTLYLVSRLSCRTTDLIAGLNATKITFVSSVVNGIQDFHVRLSNRNIIWSNCGCQISPAKGRCRVVFRFHWLNKCSRRLFRLCRDGPFNSCFKEARHLR
jgi:hypothetical protein